MARIKKQISIEKISAEVGENKKNKTSTFSIPIKRLLKKTNQKFIQQKQLPHTFGKQKKSNYSPLHLNFFFLFSIFLSHFRSPTKNKVRVSVRPAKEREKMVHPPYAYGIHARIQDNPMKYKSSFFESSRCEC